jgi:class 3 adenylate cyclase
VKHFVNWSIRYKLLVLLLLLAVATLGATGAIAYFMSAQAMQQAVTNQLAGVRRSKASRIETYYRTIHSHVLTLSQDRMIVDAMREFKAYGLLNKQPLPAQFETALLEDYRTRFYPEMQKLHWARPRVEDYLPVTPAAIRLQYEYIAKNANPAGRRRDLESVGDGSEYDRIHAKYHRPFRRIIEEFGYYDLYLIDYATGRAVYDVNKDRDFGMSLQNGPYRTSDLAKLMRQCLNTNNADDVFFSDFEPYEAAKGEPTQWIASPIFDGNERLGILALQLSTEAIDDVLTGQRGWQKDGLGKSGQSVIVGPQYRLRSNIRSFLEDPDAFLHRLQVAGAPEEQIVRIREYKTTILQLEARSPSVTSALEGKEGTVAEKALFGPQPSLASFMPLKIDGLNWAIESQIDLEEALRPVRQMQRAFAWAGGALLLLAVIAALWMTDQILGPVNELVKAARRVSAGDLRTEVELKWQDELGILSSTFNSMTRSIREKTEVIQQKSAENERLLLNILPGAIADRLKKGEQRIADGFAEVTVLFADVVNFTAFSVHTPAVELVSLLNDLFSRFDAASQRLGVEKIKTIGDCYMAVCGLPEPRPDHSRAAADLALELLRVIDEFNRQRGTSLQIRIGLNSGPVVAGVIGSTKFIYDLWGDTVNLASRMESTGVPNAIHVTENVYKELCESYTLEERGLIEIKGKGKLPCWLLRRQLVEANAPAEPLLSVQPNS